MKYLILFLFSITAFATLNDVDKQAIWGKNILSNGGFENGKAGWTASGGTFALVTSSTNLLTGKVSATWDSGSAAQTLTAVATIPQGLYGKNGVAVCKTQTPSGTATHTLGVTATAGTLVSSAITSSTTPVYDYRNFIFPSSGSVTIAITSVAADEPLIAIDDCFLGDASEVNLTNVSQAQFIGSGYFATTANCTFTRSSTSLGALSDSDCPGATVESNPGPGTIQTTDYDAPKFAVNNLPPGTYEVCFQGVTTGNSQFAAIAINDGTTTAGQSGSGSDTTANQFRVCAWFSYTTSGNRTFEIFVSSAASAYNIYNATANNQTSFSIKRFPLSTEQAYRPDAMANSWSGYHDNTCSWARGNTAFGDPAADATCAFTERTNANFGTVTSYLSGSDKLPGIVFTPKRAGRYYVCGNPAINHTGLTTSARLWDGTTTIAEVDATNSATTRMSLPLCGIYVASSTAAKTLSIQVKSSAAGTVSINALSGAASVEWSIFAIDQQLPAPLLVNSVTSNSSGVEGIHRAFITNTGTPTISSGDQSGTWIDSITDGGAGVMTLNFSSGVFSRKPACIAMCIHNGTNCSVFAYNNTVEPSTTSIQLVSRNSAGTAVDEDIMVMCMGPR